jgi:hypothetical protein
MADLETAFGPSKLITKNNADPNRNYTRSRYDDCTYDKALRQSMAPLNYRLFPGQAVNDQSCHAIDATRANAVNRSGELHANTVHGRNHFVDVETSLQGRNNPAGECSEYWENPLTMPSYEQYRNTSILAGDCGSFLRANNTKMSDPDSTLRELRLDDSLVFDHLPINPQANIYWDCGLNSRIATKDSYYRQTFKPNQPQLRSFSYADCPQNQ